MTIYTAEQALNPEKKEQEHPYDVELHMEHKALTADLEANENDCVYNDTTIPVIRERRQQRPRRRVWLQFILFFGMIFGLTLCVLGSIHLYRGVYYVEYRGRCGVDVVDLSVYNQSSAGSFEALKRTQTKATIDLQTTTPWMTKCFTFDEDIDIKGSVETLNVPSQNHSLPAKIRHDFDTNMTAIRDELRDLCFLMPLLPDYGEGLIPGPKDFTYFLSHRQPGDDLPLVYQRSEYYDAESSAIVDDIAKEFGVSLAELCAGASAFRATPRSGLTSTTTTTSTAPPPTLPPITHGSPLDMWYKMYPGGDALYNYHIIFIDPSWDISATSDSSLQTFHW